jgi:uncharacterized membrane protein
MSSAYTADSAGTDAGRGSEGPAGLRVRLPGGLELTFWHALLIAAITFYALAMPGDLRYKLSALGFGVCHQIASHSFFIGGHQLPLCARCSGIYLGALAALGMLAVLRRRSSRLPARHMIAILAVFFTAMLLDGINSTVQALGGGLWHTTNLLRLFTGALAGISVACMFYPVFNLSLWHPDAASRERALEEPFELVGYMVGAGVLVGLVLMADDWLFYPVSILEIAGLLTLLTMANAILVLMLTRREGRARTFSDALTPLLVGLLLTLIELSLLAWGRASLAPYLANNIGMPVVPGLP